MRIGLFGGSFNPIHHCHLLVAEQAWKRLHLDQILFIPTGDPPHKSNLSLAPAHHRLEMVRLATTGYQQFSVSEIETRSSEKCYTIDTLHILRQKYMPGTEFFFVVGLDAFLDFPSWKKAAQLLSQVNFVVISRPGRHFSDLTPLTILPPISPSVLHTLDAGTLDRQDISISKSCTLSLLVVSPCPISASTIRLRLKRKTPISDLLPPSVESYIIKHRLYDP